MEQLQEEQVMDDTSDRGGKGKEPQGTSPAT
jgi:hypothetical protein